MAQNEHESPSRAADTSHVETLLRWGGEITGSAVAGAVGFYTAGPFGAAAAGAIGTVTGGLLADVAVRLLSQRERVRIGAVAQYAYAQIRKNEDAGLSLRNDQFTKSEPGGRSNAHEVFEGILLKAQREHEERKLQYLGQFYANAAFDRYCSAAQANYLLNLIGRLTYQQLVMIRTFRPSNTRGVRITRLPGEEELTPVERELIARPLVGNAISRCRGKDVAGETDVGCREKGLAAGIKCQLPREIRNPRDHRAEDEMQPPFVSFCTWPAKWSLRPAKEPT